MLFKFILLVLILSCNHDKKERITTTPEKEKHPTTVYTDTAVLASIVDFRKFKPTQVEFNYELFNRPILKTAPIGKPQSNYLLQAVLYFDSSTFRHLQTTYFYIDYQAPNYNREDFNFRWLDPKTRSQLLNSKLDSQGHPDYFFGLGEEGQLWFLPNKVLLKAVVQQQLNMDSATNLRR